MALTQCRNQKGKGRIDMVATQFMRVMEFLRSLRDREEGQGLVEYALIIALVSIALITVLGEVTGALHGVFETIKNALP
jgi:pilus assembly protein Flp/PilA